MKIQLTRFAVLAFMIYSFASSAQAQFLGDPPPYPAPGRMVHIGGWHLHLHCTGESRAGQPTVILEAGIGDFSVEWSLVQPGVSNIARVCSYDRAGDGWSEVGPHPRTFKQIVYELHTLLHLAGEQPPYIMVGHSYGGWLVRLYQATYPSEVIGMVLVEAGASDPWRLMPDGKLVRSSELNNGATVPPIKTSGPLKLEDIPPAALRQMREGIAYLSENPNQPPRDKLPQDARRMRSWALGQLGHVLAAVNPFENEELAGLRAVRTKREFPLDDMPLVVITRGISEEEGPDNKKFEAEHREDHADLARMSKNGKLVIAMRSGHHVQLDEPELVVTAIQKVIAEIKH